MLENKKVIIFDLDGTLIDSVGMWNGVDSKLIAALGGTPDDEDAIGRRRDRLLEAFCALPDPYLAYCAQLGKDAGADASPEEIKRLRYRIANDCLKTAVRPKPGAAALLRTLTQMGKTLALASTTSRANVDIYMHQNEHIRAQMDFSALFSCIFTRDDVDEIKPSPKMHHLVMQTLGVSPKDCLVVEDSLAGVLAAEAAGIAVWAVYDRFAQKDQAAICARADHYFASCTAMLDFVKGAQTSPPTLDNNQSE